IDLSNLSKPGAGAMPAPNIPSPPSEALMPAMSPPSAVAAPETGINPAVPPAPPKGGTPVGTPNPVPHERLLAMVHGLAIGMSNAAKSMSTGGREGGASGVIADE